MCNNVIFNLFWKPLISKCDSRYANVSTTNEQSSYEKNILKSFSKIFETDTNYEMFFKTVTENMTSLTQKAYLENSWLTKKGCPVFTLYRMMSFKSCSNFSWLTRSSDRSRSISFWSSSGALHSKTRLVLLVAWKTALSSIKSTASFRNWEWRCLSGRLANQGTLLVNFFPTAYPEDDEREGTATSSLTVTFSYDPETSCFPFTSSTGWDKVMISAEDGILNQQVDWGPCETLPGSVDTCCWLLLRSAA